MGIEEPLTVVNTNEFSAAYNTEKQLIGLKTIIKYVLENQNLKKYNYQIGLLFKEYIRVYDMANNNIILGEYENTESIRNSTSWKITKPLRSLKDVINLCKSIGIVYTMKVIVKKVLRKLKILK